MPVYHVGMYKSQSIFLPECGELPFALISTLGELTDPAVLFRLKPNVTQSQIAVWSQTAKEMVGKIPGRLIALSLSRDSNRCLVATI